MGHKLRWQMRVLVLAIAAIAVVTRLMIALKAWHTGYNTEIQSYLFCVAFPASLIVVLTWMKPTRTREGLLMRFGTMLQLLLIISIPPFALHLVLGLPFVFLVVELFTRRVPKILRQPIERGIIA
jgi:hypothetical protein